MGDRFVPTLPTTDLVAGGMKLVEVEGRELVLCNCAGRFYAIERRCGHMNAPLEMGTLVGTVLTCPMHCAQFDVATGEALAGPVPHAAGNEQAPPKLERWLGTIGMLMAHVHTQEIRTYETKVESGMIGIALAKRQDA
ncbi:MAG TPA: Rieske 2Fe-2S domain-containing protein [Polyangia bacterium]